MGSPPGHRGFLLSYFQANFLGKVARYQANLRPHRSTWNACPSSAVGPRARWTEFDFPTAYKHPLGLRGPCFTPPHICKCVRSNTPATHPHVPPPPDHCTLQGSCTPRPKIDKIQGSFQLNHYRKQQISELSAPNESVSELPHFFC